MRVLRRELGVDPGAATRELFERILKAEPKPESRELAAAKPQTQKVRPLVGRAEEWQHLSAAWQSAMEDGTTRDWLGFVFRKEDLLQDAMPPISKAIPQICGKLFMINSVKM